MKKTLLLTLALAAALAHSETFNAPHTDGDKKVVLGGAGVALTPEVAQLHEQAVAALFSGQARAAIPLLDKAIARYEKQFAADPRQRYAASGNVETLFYLTKAANEGKEAYIIDPRWAELYYLRAYAHNELGELAAGKADLDALLALQPANAQALNERGFYYQREKNWQAAAAAFEQAAEFSPWIEETATRQKMYGAAQRGLGFTLIERGRWQDAEAIYQKLLQENPHDDRARNELEYIRQQRAKHPAL